MLPTHMRIVLPCCVHILEDAPHRVRREKSDEEAKMYTHVSAGKSEVTETFVYIVRVLPRFNIPARIRVRQLLYINESTPTLG